MTLGRKAEHLESHSTISNLCQISGPWAPADKVFWKRTLRSVDNQQPLEYRLWNEMDWEKKWTMQDTYQRKQTGNGRDARNSMVWLVTQKHKLCWPQAFALLYPPFAEGRQMYTLTERLRLCPSSPSPHNHHEEQLVEQPMKSYWQRGRPCVLLEPTKIRRKSQFPERDLQTLSMWDEQNENK